MTGPPGTGKSQVISEIIINSLFNGQTVLFTSKNHKAVDVVVERLNSLSNTPPILRLGDENSLFDRKLLEYLEKLTDPSTVFDEDLKIKKDKYIALSNSYNSSLEIKSKIIKFRNQIDEAENKICNTNNPYRTVINNTNIDYISELKSSFESTKKSYYLSFKENQESLLKKLLWFHYKKVNTTKFNDDLEHLTSLLEHYNIKPAVIDKSYFDKLSNEINKIEEICNYKKSLSELNNLAELETVDSDLIKIKKDQIDLAKEIWDLHLKTLELPPDLKQWIGNIISDLKLGNPVDVSAVFKTLSHYMPCIAVTSLRLKSQLPFTKAMFDIAVIDEASMCDIACVLPVLYRAKKAVIIGDSNQQNI